MQEQRVSYHTNMETPLPYLDRRPLTYLVSPCPELISRKIDPQSFFSVLGAPWLLHNTPPPNKVTEPHIHQLPKQIQAPTEAGGQLESFQGKQMWRATDYMGLTLVCVPEGKMPIG